VLFEEIKRAADWGVAGKKAREEYVRLLSQFFEKYYGGKNNEEARADILRKSMDDIEKDQDSFALGLTEGIRSYPNDKYALACRLEDFIIYLRCRRGFTVSEDLLSNYKCKDKNERLLKILKYLHTGGKSRAEIAEAFGISERALSADLNLLQNGYTFLGNEMKIRELGRGTNTYSSMIHPIFLALNTEEIYTMTVGLKLLGKNTVFAESIGRVADKIYEQLSHYAKEMVDSHVDGESVTFGQSDLVFLNSYELMRKSRRPFPYFLKEPLLCQIVYQENGQMTEITGILRLAESGYDRVVVQSKNGETEIHMDDVESIVRAEKTGDSLF